MSDAIERNRRIREQLKETITTLRRDIGHVDEPQIFTLTETAAEALTGITARLEKYEENEKGLQESRLTG